MQFPAIPSPDAEARAEAVRSAGPSGRLTELGAWLAGAQGQCPPVPPSRPRMVVIAGDHGVAAAEVSVAPAGSTGRQVDRLREATSAAAAAASVAQVLVQVVDVALDREPTPTDAHRIRRGSGRIDREDALTADETDAAFAVGRALVDAAVDEGADLLVLGSLGVGASAAAEVLVAALTGTEPVAVTGRGDGIDDATWMRRVATVRDALRRTRSHRDDPMALLRVAGGADLAALCGFCVQAAVRRTPLLFSGEVVAAAALSAARLAPGADAWWLAADRSPDPVTALVLDRLDLHPVLDLGMPDDTGTAAAVAVPVLRTAALLAATPG